VYLEKYDLSGRVAVVTGGGRNIGLACVQALAEANAKVVIAEVDPDVGAAGMEELSNAGIAAELRILDVTKPAAVTEVADQIVADHGRVDILVSNAGICFHAPCEEIPDDQWRQVMDVNVNGVYWCCRAFGRHMLAAGRGSIVNLGSMSGIIANKPQPQAHYNASKAAVHTLTKSLAAEWGDRGVRVNAVAPTYIDTAMTRDAAANPDWFPTWIEMTPMHRMGQCDEIASVVLFLASDAASLLTGSIVVADGGYTSW
jgi:NAD(P)-dependent dehydrogenase (short-subunit alcohol dehydrogenase family)